MKSTRPSSSHAIRRTRLFRKLDACKRIPLTWIQGLPGIGKTTMVSSYVSDRQLRTVWYKVDPADSDVASFFYYLGLTVPGPRHRLPLLTPEAQSTLTAFTRRFFRALYAGIRPPFVIVFDNYQDAPDNAALHEVVCDAVAEMPRGGRVFILSREAPPRAFARLRASGEIHVLNPNELVLTATESRQLWKRLVGARPAARQAAAVHRIVQGWAAGLVLLAEHVKSRHEAAVTPPGGSDIIFQYFASELLDRATPEMQQVLLTAAFVPRLTGLMAVELSGVSAADHLLVSLYEKGYFISRHPAAEPGAEPVYEFHPLFRDFLIQEGHQRLTPAEGGRIARAAADMLDRDGRVEAAATLFRETADWNGLATLIRARAHNLLTQGRSQTLLTCLSGLPVRFVEEDGWMLLWRAGCHIASNPQACREDCEKAIRLFLSVPDAGGAYLAWSTAVFSIVYESVSAKLFDPWLSLFDDLRRQFPEFPAEDIEARVAISMLAAVAWRQPHRHDAEWWAARAFDLTGGERDVNARVQTLFIWVMHHIQNGNFQAAITAVPELWRLAKLRQLPPVSAVIARVAIAWTWIAGNETSGRAAAKGLTLAQSTAVANGDCECLLNLAAIALHDGDGDTATRRLRELERRLGTSGRAYVLWYHTYSIWEALLRNRTARAASAAKSALQAMKTGRPWDEAVALTLIVHALHESGEKEESRQQLSHLLTLTARMGSPFIEFMALLVDAHLSFDEQRDSDAMLSLARAMQLGRQGGFFYVHGWRASVMRRLCARALDAHIEVDYVRALIQKHRLFADASVSADLELWPRPVRIYTFGRFSVIRDDAPLTFSRKVQRRPLALLKALIALGGRDVREEALVDALWHDSEGDAAYRALTTALHRLRGLLGRADAVTRQVGRVSLNPQLVWIDTWALDRILDRAASAIRASSGRDAAVAGSLLTNRAVGWYRGACLAGENEEPLATSLAERLARRLVRQLLSEGAIFAREQDWPQAIDRYEKAAEISPHAADVRHALASAYRHVTTPAAKQTHAAERNTGTPRS